MAKLNASKADRGTKRGRQQDRTTSKPKGDGNERQIEARPRSNAIPNPYIRGGVTEINLATTMTSTTKTQQQKSHNKQQNQQQQSTRGWETINNTNNVNKAQSSLQRATHNNQTTAKSTSPNRKSLKSTNRRSKSSRRTNTSSGEPCCMCS